MIKNMKRRTKILIAVFILAAVLLAWYITPVRFIPELSSGVWQVMVFNGNNGQTVAVTDPEAIDSIVKEFRGMSFRRTGLALGMGTSYHLTFLSNDGSTISSFILQSSATLKRGAFFYAPTGSAADYTELCDYLAELTGWQYQR